MKYLVPVLALLFSISATTFAEKGGFPADTGIISFHFKNLNFVKDNEYSSAIIEGYTLIGYFIQPSFVWTPGERVSLALGVQILNYSGTDKIRSPALIFSTSFKVSKTTTLTLGTYDGGEKHRMADPIYDRERMYRSYTESGGRLISESKFFFNDVWLNWENFIFRGDTTREIFHLGESFNYVSPSFGGGFNLEIPIQMNFKHLGGQISDYPEHVESFFDGSAGLRINYEINNGKLGSIGIEYRQFRFQYISAHGTFPIKSGDAFWLRLHYNFRSLYFGTYYWKSHNFYAPDGNQIYSSVSTHEAGTIVPDRSIWTNSFYYKIHPLPYFELFAGIDTYYDLRHRHMDTLLALHLCFDKFIRIGRLK